MTAPTHRLRRLLLVAGATLVLPAAPAAAYSGDVDRAEGSFVVAAPGSNEAAPSGPALAPAPGGEPDVLLAADMTRRLRSDPAPCTYADKSYSDGSVVKMDGGVLRECQNGRWVPYQAPPKS